MQTMTYGIMPAFDDFEKAFDRECPRGSYAIRLNSSDSRACDPFKLGDGDWNARELYDACVQVVTAEPLEDDYDTAKAYRDALKQYDAVLDLVSSIMDTLGFEWI